MGNVLGIELNNCNRIRVIEMIKDGELIFQTQLKPEFLPPNDGSKKCSEKSLMYSYTSVFKSFLLKLTGSKNYQMCLLLVK